MKIEIKIIVGANEQEHTKTQSSVTYKIGKLLNYLMDTKEIEDYTFNIQVNDNCDEGKKCNRTCRKWSTYPDGTGEGCILEYGLNKN